MNTPFCSQTVFGGMVLFQDKLAILIQNGFILPENMNLEFSFRIIIDSYLMRLI
jgi:hypothetical protein